jgi:3-phenylpropionate/trans-cinnamate dioxygenase ferredoxin subunit
MADPYIRVADVDELPPGKMRRIEIGQRRILLANVDGRFYATDDVCTHEDASLSTGSLKGEWVKCPLHGSRFSVRTGEVVDQPAEVGLRTFAVRVDANAVCVDPGPEDL